jgi:hypothetical protein
MRAPQAAKKGKVQERGTSLLRNSTIPPDPIADEKPTYRDLMRPFPMRGLGVGITCLSAETLSTLDVLRRIEDADMVTGVVRVETSFIDSHTVHLGSVLAHYAGAEFGICCLCLVEPVVATDCVSTDVSYL